MQNIPFFNYPEIYKENEEEYRTILNSTCKKGAFIMQKELAEFEESLSEFLGCKHAIGVADGTAALIFSLKSAGIKAGDEVIVSSHTFIATAAAIHHVGGIPRVCDCLPDSTFDYLSAEKLISNKTKALMPTQLNGRTSNMDGIQKLARKYNLKIIEDSCQALGSKFKGINAGLFGVAGSYSFYPAKTLGCFGDGGAVVTNDDEIAEYIRTLRDHGRDSKGEVITWGHNARLDNIQAAILNCKLKSYNEKIEKRRDIANIYDSYLKDIKEVSLPPSPKAKSNNFDIYQNYEIQVERRAELQKFLKENGVGTIIQWGGWMLHQFSKLNLVSNAPYAEKMSKRMLLLPMNHILTKEEVIYICDLINRFFEKNDK